MSCGQKLQPSDTQWVRVTGIKARVAWNKCGQIGVSFLLRMSENYGNAFIEDKYMDFFLIVMAPFSKVEDLFS